jgi:phosphoserine phosphatase RsbU/P
LELANSKILIVDDNVKNLQVLGGFLQNEGFQVEFALEGRSAIDWIGRSSFDLVLLDIMMPGIDGYEVCKTVKADGKNKDLPIIFLTAKTDHESIIEGFSVGAVDYITKPFIKDELLARVKTHLEIKLSRDKLALYLAEIEEKNRDITASIQYAKSIQEAMLKTSDPFKIMFPDHFILFLPKDIVSGDFYWFKSVDNVNVIAVMDCTGHGVPGALMSSIGVTLLNETVSHERILSPDLILESLRSKLIVALGQKDYSDKIKDGIEGSVFSFDLTKNYYGVSGSGNPMVQIHNGELIEIKPQRIPIGLSEKKISFLKVPLNVSKNDMFYMFSDGYIDQFGGPSSKRFMIKKLKEVLSGIHHLPLEEQKARLLAEILHWRGDLEQTDDILVLGIRL